MFQAWMLCKTLFFTILVNILYTLYDLSFFCFPIMAYVGEATAEDIDAAMMKGCGYPMGPLKLADVIGIDTLKMVTDGRSSMPETGIGSYRHHVSVGTALVQGNRPLWLVASTFICVSSSSSSSSSFHYYHHHQQSHQHHHHYLILFLIQLFPLMSVLS